MIKFVFLPHKFTLKMSIQIGKMIEKVQNIFTKLVIISLLFSFANVNAQATFPPNAVKSEPAAGLSITDSNYTIGKLKVNVNLATSSDANVVVTLPVGITMKGTNVALPKGGSISDLVVNKNVITFTIKGATGAVEFSFDKLITPEGHKNATAAATLSLEDKVSITQGGNKQEEKSNAYSYLYPSLSVRKASANDNSKKGDNQVEFEILNGGNGKAYDIYFTLTYPASDILYKKTEYNGQVLTPIRTQGTTYTFKIEKSKINGGNGLANNESVTIKETYTQTDICLSSKNIGYEVNWGSSDNATDWYQARDNKATRTVSSPVGSPNIEMTRKDSSKPNIGSNPENMDYTKSYFIRDKGLCGAVGSKLGTMRVSYTNYGTNNTSASAAYRIKIFLREGWYDESPAFFRVDNVRLVTASGTTPLPAGSVKAAPTTFVRTTGQHKAYEVDFSGFTSDPDGAGVGLDDLDGDGKYNDLPSGQSYVLEYDLIKFTDVSNVCINKDYGTAFRHLYFNYLDYKDACGNGASLESRVNELRMFHRYYNVSDASYMPNSLYKNAGAENVRFVVGGSSFSFIEYDYRGLNVAYSHLQYVVKVPNSIKVNPATMKWFESNGYPSSNPAEAIPASNIVTTTDASGITYKITAPKSGLGFVTMDMEANCTGASTTAQVEYQVLVLDKSDTQECAYKIVCGTKDINIVCDSNCGNDGPIILKTTAERAESSYGWTDNTMTTRHTKATLSERMKKRALYLDDIEVTAKGKQARGTANNLYYSFTTNEGVSLKPKSITVKITSGALAGTTTTLNTVTVTPIGSGAKQQKLIIWDLTGALNGQSLQQDDEFEVVATYEVDYNSGAYSTAQDIVAAKKSYFYMLQGGVEKYCGSTIEPEFYVANTYVQMNGLNTYTVKGCDVTTIGNYMIHWARRFAPSGTKFIGEFRPDRLVKTSTFVLPNTYKVTRIQYDYKINANASDSRRTIDIPISDFVTSPDVTPNHTKYTFENTIDPVTGMYKMPPGLITLSNEYPSLLRVFVQATCASTTDRVTEKGKTETYFYDYYYHYGKASTSAQDGRIPGQVIQQDNPTELPMLLEQKPSISLQAVGNTSFSVTEKEQELVVKLSNTSATSVAPYTWLSIPEVSGLEVIGVWEGSTQLTKQPTITGQYMYHLDGVTNCANATLKVYAGWNCSEFSKGYNDEKTCSAANKTGLDNTIVTYELQHSGSEIQLTRLKQPHEGTADVGKLKMCEDNWYEYEINSSKPADVLQPTLSINKETGIKIHKVEVFYPFNASSPIKTYEEADATDTGTAWQYKLLNTGQVLKGSASTTDINERKIKLRISVLPECDVRAGTAFAVEIQGKNTCLGPLDGVRDASIPSAIVGVPNVNYSVETKLIYSSGNANACSTGAVYQGTHKVNLSLGTTGTTGKIVIRVPKEYEVTNFTLGTKNGTFANPTGFENPNPSVVGVTREYRIPVPSGMSNLNSFTYSVTVKQLANSPANCNATQKIEYYAIDEVPPVHCPKGGCINKMTTVVGTPQDVAIKVERSVITISDLTITTKPTSATQERLTFNFKVNTNAIAYTGNLVVKVLYDQNNNSQVDNTDTVVGTINLTGLNIPANSNISQTSNIDVDADKVCRLLVSIDSNDNTCLCSINPIVAPIPNPIEGLVKDLTVCEGESKVFEAYNNIPTYTSYHWASTDATAMTYLSADNVLAPTFKYIGTPLTAVKTIAYTLEITRANGCKATQNVTVTVNPASAAPTITSPRNYVGTKTVQDLINDIKAENSALSSATIKVYDVTGTELPSTTVLTSATYKVSVTQTGQCESKKTDVVLNIMSVPPTLFNISPICSTSQATIKTIKDAIKVANPTVTNIKVFVDGVEATDDTTVLDATKTYKVTATKSGVTTDELTVSVTKQTDTPTNNSVHFCEPTSATVANLKTKLLGTRTGVTINVYASNNVTTHPSAMADTETLADQGVYSYTETKTGECESVRKNVTITIITKPTSGSYDFCSGKTVLDLKQKVNPANTGIIKVYKNGIEVNDVTALFSGTYEVSKFSSECETDKVSQTVNVFALTVINTHPSSNEYCQGATIQALSVNAVGNDLKYKWFENTINSNTGGTEILGATTSTYTPSNSLGKKYYYVTITGTCGTETSNVAEINIKSTPSSPSIGSQSYCSSENKTLGDLSSIAGLKWYDASVGGNVLLSTTKLQTGKYYASVTQDGCESVRTEVDVTITASPVKPEVEVLSAANCNSITRFKLKNEETGVTYELENGVAVVIDATTKELKNLLGVGKYKLIAKRGTCSSEASLEFEVFGQIVVGVPTVAPARTECPTSSSSQFDMSSLVTASAGHTLKWYESATGARTTSPQVERLVTSKTTYTKYVSQSNGTCESSREPVIYVVDDTDTPTLSLPSNDLTIDCRSLTFDMDVQTWLNSAVGHDDCAFTLTNNYVKPTDLCTKGEIEVTFTVTDKFGKKVEGKKKIKLLHIDAVDDAEQTVSRTTGGNITVLSNDSYKGVTPVNVTDVTVTVVSKGSIPGSVDVNTDGTLKIPAGTPAGDYTIRYKICSKDHPTVCDEADAKVKVTPNNIVAVDDDYTVNGVVKVSTSESIVKDTTNNTDKNILSNDILGGTTGLSVGNVSITQVSTTNAGVTIDTATGKVKVSGNTPAGTYEIVYKIKENGTSNESNTAKVKVRVVNVLEAKNDSFTGKTPTNSTPQVVGNILTNDKLNGNPPTPGNVTITEETPASPITPGSKVPRLNTTTGDVEIPQGTPPGTYEITYKICNSLSDPNCVTAKITVNVTGNTIVAQDDDYRTELINGETGNANVGNILTNPNGQDTLDGAQATTSNVVISVVTPAGTGVVPTIEESTGKVSVPAHTAGGDYEITYKICEQDGSGNAINNCATAKVKLRVITLEATDDDYSSTPTPQKNTEAKEYEVLGNDKRNGQNPVPASKVKVTITNSAGIPGVTVDDTTGKVKIPSGTPAGVYELTYQICEKDHLGNASSICSSAKLKVKVEQSNTNTVLAKDDKVQVTRVNNRREKTFNVFADNGNGVDTDPQGDTFTLTTHTQPAHGTLTQVAGQPSSFTYVPDGNFVGTDSFTYKICDNVAAPNGACSTATVTIEVRDIEANDDDFRTVVVNSAVGNTNIGNVLTNHTTGANKIDVLKNGSVGNEVAATPTNVSVSVTNDDGLSTPLRIGSDGTISLSDGNYASKEYTVEYQICEKGLASGVTNCDTAKVQLKVVRIKAQDNSYTGIDGINGNANVGNVLDNDEYDSSTTKPTLSTVTLREVRGATALEAGKPVPVLDVTSGKVSVPANTPNGDYEIEYEICRKDYPSICSQAKIIVKVTGNIQAVDDQIRGVNGKRGGSLSNNRVPDANGNPYNVLSNDKLNGNPVSTSTVEITQGVEATPKELGKPSPKVTKTGFVEVPPNTPAGTYEVEYEICNLPGKTRCATAKVTIEVVSPKIEAKNDNFGRVLVKDNSITTSTVLTNDIYDGGQASLTDVLLSTDTNKPVPAGITLNVTNGTLTVAQGVPAGVYKYPYQICDKLDATNCSQAEALVEVLDERVSILAVNDDLGILSQRGGTTSDNVLTNDYLNGKINPSYTTEVLLKPGTSPRTGLVMNSDGTITVIIGSNIPAGDYEYPYEICDRVNPTNCSSAKAKVTISSSPFNAINDRYEIKNEELSKGAQTTPSVLKNDELNGKIGLSLTDVSLTPGTSPHSGIVMNPDGTITIQPNVPIETYRYPYTICDKLNPTDCRTAVAIIVLEPSALEANPDDYTSRPIRGTGGQVGSILENDRLKNRPVNSNEVRITLENDGGLTGVTIDGEGQVHVPAHSPVGVYVLTYQICEASNLRNCRSTTIKVRVIDGRELKYYNGISVDGNGENDKFVIEGIESYPDNVLRIFNRWGVLVYEKRGYNNEDDAFVGLSNGRVVISKDTKLPQGTYYYVLEYIDELGAKHRKASWLYIKREE